MPPSLDLDPRDRPIVEAVVAARRAFADPTLAEKFDALALLEYWLEVERAGWERAQDPRTH
jgi:hypothetical protein